MAARTGKYAEPLYLAGYGRRTALRHGRGASPRDGRAHVHGRRVHCARRDPHGRHLPRRHDVLRRSARAGGRAGDPASTGITASLAAMGFETGRMKTGTPARLDARTIDFEALEPQYGDENPLKFSFSTDTQPVKHQSPCFLVYTSPEVHATLRTGFDRSPLFNGTIPRHRTALLPLDRGQAAHLRRQGTASVIP